MSNLQLDIKRLIIEVLNLEDLTPADIATDAPLFGDGGLGLDSIDALELGVALRRKYGISLEAEDPRIKTYFHSVDTLAQLLQERGVSSP
jgi:acyl carrier protein